MSLATRTTTSTLRCIAGEATTQRSRFGIVGSTVRLSTSALVIFGFVGSGYSESELPNADGMRTDGSPIDCASRAALLIVVSLELGEFAIAAVSDATMEFAELETGADEVEEACAGLCVTTSAVHSTATPRERDNFMLVEAF